MPEWTAEVIWSISGAGMLALVIGWLVGRFGGGRVSRADFERLVADERTARHELTTAKARQRRLEDELAAADTNRSPAGDAEPGRDLGATARALRDSSLGPDDGQPADDLATRIAAAASGDERQLAGMNASLLEELDAARLRFARLHGSQAGLAAELDLVRDRMADLEEENTRLGADLASSGRRVDELDELQARIGEHLEAARAQVAAYEARAATASDDLLTARTRIGAVEGKLTAALSDLQGASEDLDSVQSGLHEDREGEPESSSEIDLTDPGGAIDLTDDDRSAAEVAADAADADAERRAAPIDTWRA